MLGRSYPKKAVNRLPIIYWSYDSDCKTGLANMCNYIIPCRFAPTSPIYLINLITFVIRWFVILINLIRFLILFEKNTTVKQRLQFAWEKKLKNLKPVWSNHNNLSIQICFWDEWKICSCLTMTDTLICMQKSYSLPQFWRQRIKFTKQILSIEIFFRNCFSNANCILSLKLYLSFARFWFHFFFSFRFAVYKHYMYATGSPTFISVQESTNYWNNWFT